PTPLATREELVRPARATARPSPHHPPARIPGRISNTPLRQPVLHAKLPGSLHTRPANCPDVPATSHTGATRRAGRGQPAAHAPATTGPYANHPRRAHSRRARSL